MVKMILRDDLGYVKRHRKYIPHDLTTDQKKVRHDGASALIPILKHCKDQEFRNLITLDETWIRYGTDHEFEWCEPGRTPRPSPKENPYSKNKVLITVAFSGEGVIFIDATPPGETITSAYFITNTLNEIAKLPQYQLPSLPHSSNARFFIHYDNAPCHSSKMTNEALAQTQFCRLPHPPYSPDLSPCGYFLFGTIKPIMKKTCFLTREEAIQGFVDAVASLKKDLFVRTMYSWIKRCEQVVESKGEYFAE